ncbi:MAG: hypothetical protein IPO63_02095 [Bacteroidetes bacterium]|nr:hypothetical protein [Bacteroidota bacterium]
MKKFILCLGIVALVFGLNACKSEKEKEEACAPTSLNPNGDSELALLMRDMAKLSEANAISLREGKELALYKGEFNSMKKAERTMKDLDETFFQGMADTYLTNMQKLYDAKPEDRISLHNNVVESCQACHNQICPGPLKRIDKMLVKI